MDFTRLTYSGRKPYNDKAGTVWAPGDTHLVAPDTAKRLLRFVEFAQLLFGSPQTAQRADQIGMFIAERFFAERHIFLKNLLRCSRISLRQFN